LTCSWGYCSGIDFSGNHQVNQATQEKELRTPGDIKPITTLQMVKRQYLLVLSKTMVERIYAQLFLDTSGRRSDGVS